MYTGTLKKGDKLTIEREYEFGKTGTEIVTVVGIFQEGKAWFALLDNGQKLYILPPLSSNQD
ncbi:MAG TPA: hypothetical protein PLW93_02105 [Candidatus Absconditabacterales bacterium]|nr:hypothetical protein [Candidatus Absconditabacterales bacterium]HNG97043.1 hypothetical protein [Candidatus Absconditabacterales bacterium]